MQRFIVDGMYDAGAFDRKQVVGSVSALSSTISSSQKGCVWSVRNPFFVPVQ